MLPLDQQYDTRTILNKKSNFPNNFCKSIPMKSAPTGCPKKRVTFFVNPGLMELPFYAPISSVVNISMLTNKKITVFEAYF